VRADNAEAVTNGVTRIRGSDARPRERAADNETSGRLAVLPKTLAVNGVVNYVRCISSSYNLYHPLAL